MGKSREDAHDPRSMYPGGPRASGRYSTQASSGVSALSRGPGRPLAGGDDARACPTQPVGAPSNLALAIAARDVP